jgi:hypothetical protein
MAQSVNQYISRNNPEIDTYISHPHRELVFYG